MFDLLGDAIKAAFRWVFQVSIVKWLLVAIAFACMEVGKVVVSALFPDWFTLTGLFDAIPSGVWYFLDVLRFDLGAPLIFSAWLTKFLIRRLPIVG